MLTGDTHGGRVHVMETITENHAAFRAQCGPDSPGRVRWVRV